jgi:hypothetical protein
MLHPAKWLLSRPHAARGCGAPAATTSLRGRHRIFVAASARPVWRPSLDDVDSISYGGPAKVPIANYWRAHACCCEPGASEHRARRLSKQLPTHSRVTSSRCSRTKAYWSQARQRGAIASALSALQQGPEARSTPDSCASSSVQTLLAWPLTAAQLAPTARRPSTTAASMLTHSVRPGAASQPWRRRANC